MNKRTRNTTVSVSMAVVAILTAATATAASSLSASADATAALHATNKLVVSVYADAPGGASAIAGAYDDTIGQLSPRGGLYRGDLLGGSTNLCVAYTLTRSWDEARAACDDAVVHARAEDAGNVLRIGAHSPLALAYSNRAVLNWVQHRTERAVADVERAHSLAPKSEQVAQNWAILTGRPEVATAAVAMVQR